MSYYDWPSILSKYKDNDLLRIMKDGDREPLEKVAAAEVELKKRGLWSDNLRELVDNVRARQSKWNPDFPTLFSKIVIYVFSIFFSAIFGIVLFGLNLKAVGQKKGIVPASIFIVLLALVDYFVLRIWNAQEYTYLLTNVLGAIVLNEVFWKKYIGVKADYNKRDYRPALRIGLIYIALLLILEFAMGIPPFH